MDRPGPAGAGLCVFNPRDCSVTDLGADLGHNTNNVGELVALGICFRFIMSLAPAPTRVFIFTDSLLAANAATSTKEPRSHPVLVRALRALFAEASVSLQIDIHWIRGHAGVGGNERADRIAKRFAKLSLGAVVAKPSPELFNFSSSTSPWPFGLCGDDVPFTSGLPAVSLTC